MIVSVRQLINTVDASMVLELYALGKANKFEHRGTYNLDVADSRESLLQQYGDVPVRHSDKYKAYVVVYLDGQA